MPTQYVCRLYTVNPLENQALAAFAPDVYGPSRWLAAWPARFDTGDAYAEQLVTFSDPVNGQVSNVNAIDFRAGLPSAADRDVLYAGLCSPSSQGAQFAGLRVQAIPLSVVALPGGRKRVTGAGRYSVAAGALTFTLS